MLCVVATSLLLDFKKKATVAVFKKSKCVPEAVKQQDKQGQRQKKNGWTTLVFIYSLLWV
jgi:hypothetical protein